MNAHQVSWKYYGDQWNNYVPDPYQQNYGTPGPTADEYCNICNPFQYDTSIMSHPDQVTKHIQDSVNLYADIANRTLPAVSIVKPSGYTDGHPASSKLQLFEGFVKKIVDQVQASPYAKDTAIFITFDEGGGYYDSGYVQPVDFFGDGTRIPLIVVSSVREAGAHLARLRRSRLDPEVHRAQLELAAGHASQPGQLPESARERRQSLCAAQFAGARGFVRSVRLRLFEPAITKAADVVAAAAAAAQKSAAGTSIKVGPEASSAPRTASVNWDSIVRAHRSRAAGPSERHEVRIARDHIGGRDARAIMSSRI